MQYRDWEMPPFAYFIAAALCFVGGGYGCDHYTNATGFGIGAGSILIAIVLIVLGICRYEGF